MATGRLRTRTNLMYLLHIMWLFDVPRFACSRSVCGVDFDKSESIGGAA